MIHMAQLNKDTNLAVMEKQIDADAIQQMKKLRDSR